MRNDVDLAVRIPRALKEAIERDIAASEARMMPSSISLVVRRALAEYLERNNPTDEARAHREIAARAAQRARKRSKVKRSG